MYANIVAYLKHPIFMISGFSKKAQNSMKNGTFLLAQIVEVFDAPSNGVGYGKKNNKTF
jgi:hypothetical protein